MKISILCIGLLFALPVFAHEYPAETGECFIVKNNIPLKTQSCKIHSGGGAGGLYTNLKINNINFLIEENEDSGLSLGNNSESLEEGTFYYRDLNNKKSIISLEKAKIHPAFYCAKQLNGNLDVCYVTN